MKESAAFRAEMADLGHPVIGPQSFWKLTSAEIRVYAEGLRHKAQRQREQQAYSGTGTDGPSYNTKSRRKRDEAALNRVDQQVKQQRQDF